MNTKVLRYVLVVSVTGFLFGFDSVVVSGVNLPVKQLWNTSDWFHGTFIISISLWGTVVGCLCGGYLTERLGRKTTLIWVGAMFTISAAGSALATGPVIFSLFRFIGGVSAGTGSIAAPTYISEIADARHRGKLGMLFQLNIVTGILMAFFSNYLLMGVSGADDWRWMLGVMALPAFAYTLFLFKIDESPRWLLLNSKRRDKALSRLHSITSNSDADGFVSRNQKAARQAQDWLFSKRYRRVLMLSFLMAFFNQFSGISFVLFYAPEILEKAGYGTSAALLSAVSIGVVNLIFTVVGMYLIDVIGRRKLMCIGSIGYMVSLSMVASGFYYGLPAGFMLTFILLFMVSHAVGQGAVIWVIIAEIFPTRVRSFGQAWGSGLLNIFAALITMLGAVLINAFAPWVVFGIFAFLMGLQLLFTIFVLPETRGVSLEDLENRLSPVNAVR